MAKYKIQIEGRDKMFSEIDQKFDGKPVVLSLMMGPGKIENANLYRQDPWRDGVLNFIIYHRNKKWGRSPAFLTGPETMTLSVMFKNAVDRIVGGATGTQSIFSDASAFIIKCIQSHFDNEVYDSKGADPIKDQYQKAKKARYGKDLPTLVASGQLRSAFYVKVDKL